MKFLTGDHDRRERETSPLGLALVSLTIALFLGCASAPSQTIPLAPDAAQVEIVTEAIDREKYEFVGDVQGEAKASDIGEANKNARNDMRNKAAALGATVVILDTNTAANAMDWTGRNKVVLAGRAFRPKAR
jgi:hypothetical protein